MLPDRFFADEPARDSLERTGRMLGDLVGLGMMVMMLWVTLEGMF